MLRSIDEIMGYVIVAEDGELGRCKDFLFDDSQWTTRYMVADTGKWLPGRKVLISPIALEEPQWETRHFPVKLTKRQIEASPPLDEHAPVSRQYEMKYFDHYEWPYYWTGGGLWGMDPYPFPLYSKGRTRLSKEEEIPPEESHLRSAKEVKGYHIQARDGEIGHVEDFITEDEDWSLRYLVVDTRHWLVGRKVLVSTSWVESVNWPDKRVTVDLDIEAIRHSPQYDPSKPINREYELRLYDYYGRPRYWNE